MSLEQKSIKSVHLVGIAGTGMGAFAGLLKQAGFDVRGSDVNTYPPMKEKLAEWGIEVRTPYQPDNLNPAPDLVIVGNVVAKDNPEATAVREEHLPHASFPQALHELFLKHTQPIVIAGTHGKTTSSALMAHTLRSAGRDPSFLIGGIPLNFSESFHWSNPKPGTGFFVVEGDEYDTAYFDKGPKFLHYAPKFLLATSLEYDHADIYENVEQIETRFTELFDLVAPTGSIVANADAPHLVKALQAAHPKATVHTYGKGGTWQAHERREGENGISFVVWHQGGKIGEVSLQLSGQHNIDNALGCYTVLCAAGLSHDEIAKGFASFASVKRRMEIRGNVDDVIVIDDFAHHPSAVKTTLEGCRERYPARTLWALFEPRSASSCRKIFQADYAASFGAADHVVLAPAGRDLGPDLGLDVPELAHAIKILGKDARAASSVDEIVDIVARECKSNSVILCMSNGSFGGIHDRILEKLRERTQTLPG